MTVCCGTGGGSPEDERKPPGESAFEIRPANRPDRRVIECTRPGPKLSPLTPGPRGAGLVCVWGGLKTLGSPDPRTSCQVLAGVPCGLDLPPSPCDLGGRVPVAHMRKL